MRFALAFLAVLALRVSPVTAAAAKAACGQDKSVAGASMDMSTMPGARASSPHVAVQKAMGDCCRDQAGHHRMSGKSCAQACAASRTATATLPTSFTAISLGVTKAPLSPPRLAPAVSHRPLGLKRPPKSVA